MEPAAQPDSSTAAPQAAATGATSGAASGLLKGAMSGLVDNLVNPERRRRVVVGAGKVNRRVNMALMIIILFSEPSFRLLHDAGCRACVLMASMSAFVKARICPKDGGQ
jgi:hypothetical protein